MIQVGSSSVIVVVIYEFSGCGYKLFRHCAIIKVFKLHIDNIESTNQEIYDFGDQFFFFQILDGKFLND